MYFIPGVSQPGEFQAIKIKKFNFKILHKLLDEVKSQVKVASHPK